MTIGTLAYKEIKTFKGATDDNGFNQYNNILRIDKYLRGEYWNCSDPTALFWQLATPRVPLYAKSIDADTKNFEMIGIGKFNWFKAFLLNVKFKQWARRERLALTLDDTSDGIATYGSMVWKKCFAADGEVSLEVVSLQNIFFDQSVKNIVDSPVIELHYMSEMEVRRRYPDLATEIIKKAKKGKEDKENETDEEERKIEVVERWGEYKEEDDDKVVYMHSITAGSGDNEVVMVEDEVKTDKAGKPKDFPYYDFHGERVPRRWQGMGVVERLYKLQEQINALVNQNSDANDIASLLLLTTNDPETQGNVLDSARTGQIINTQDMQQLGIDNRFISTFINQMALIEKKADDLCYINDSISGDTPPSGVPFRSLAVATKAAASTFKYIKTGIIEKMGYILQEDIMPDVVKGFNRDDVIDVMEGDGDLRLYDQTIIDMELREFLKGKEVLFEEDIAAKKVEIQERLIREGRQHPTPGKYFDFKWGIYMNPTGESVDKNTQNAAIDGAIQDMSANPAVVNTPLYQQKLANNGIPAFRLTPEEQAALGNTAGVKLPEAPQVDKLSQLAETA